MRSSNKLAHAVVENNTNIVVVLCNHKTTFLQNIREMYMEVSKRRQLTRVPKKNKTLYIQWAWINQNLIFVIAEEADCPSANKNISSLKRSLGETAELQRML